jgi:NAD(P)-dependent dehydrogenase (short-subunit alcohol dehydrogenase family)
MHLNAAATYAAKGVRINCVAPGLVHSPSSAPLSDPAQVSWAVSARVVQLPCMRHSSRWLAVGLLSIAWDG